jgi:hypothetical protein
MNIYIKYINFWSGFYTNNEKHDKIIKDAIRNTFKTHLVVEDDSKRPNIVVSSVFGNPNTLSAFDKDTFIIIINGENSYGHAHHRKWAYEHLKTNGYPVHLYLGFSRQDDSVHKRFPLWLWMYDFYLRSDSKAYQFVKENSGASFTSGSLDQRQRAACMCARSNFFNWRGTFYNMCTQKGITVKCPSSVCHNDTGIEARGMTKADYIAQFVFNICPENTITDGYCTEKLLECVMSGCVPIYWGDYDNETLFNQNRMIKARNVTSDFPNVVQQVKHLLSNNNDELKQFFEQPLFTDNATHVIDTFLDKLDTIPTMYAHHLERISCT